MSPFSSKIHRSGGHGEAAWADLSYFDKTSRLNDRIRVEAVIFDNTKKKSRCPRTLEGGCSYYLAIYSDQEEGCERNAGYLMEQMVLYMTAKRGLEPAIWAACSRRRRCAAANAA